VTVWIGFLCSIATVAVLLGLASPVHSGDKTLSVAVLALPTSLTSKTSLETRQVADAIASALRSANHRVVVVGAGQGQPLEELTATANTSSVDLTLGVRSLGGPNHCGVLMAPSPAPEPAQPKTAVSQIELAAFVRQSVAAERANASGRLLAIMSQTPGWCQATPTAVERYVLESTVQPTIVIAVALGDARAVASRLPDAVQKWVAAEAK
jgi:hypothetical protein